MRVVVLASGRGSNLEALLQAERDGKLPIRIIGVLSDKPAAGALEIARESGVPAFHLDPRTFAQRTEFDLALFARIAELAPDLIVLAGFMRIIDPLAFAPWLGRMINIHPSLLPNYPGLHTHRRALAAGDSQHGASVHFVSAELDGGPLIAQATIDVQPGDNPQCLADRLLPHEHRLLIASVRLLACGRVQWTKAGVLLDEQPLVSPLQLCRDGQWAPFSK